MEDILTTVPPSPAASKFLKSPHTGKRTAPIDLKDAVNPLVGQAIQIIMGHRRGDAGIVDQQIYFSVPFLQLVGQIFQFVAVGDGSVRDKMAFAGQRVSQRLGLFLEPDR